MNTSAETWRFIEAFHVPEALRPPIVSWDGALELADGLQRLADAEREERHELLKRWSEQLRDLGGDPSSHDWEKFRPLRLTREEDWSDWLAHLIAESKSGVFANDLFGSFDDSPPTALASPNIEREKWTISGHKCDLKIDWSNNKYSQVEVKVGDENFEKTYDTCDELHREFHGQWTDYVLLPENSLTAWKNTEANYGKDFSFKIESITWYQVAVALRHALWSRCESITWLAWAYAYCGAIEHRLLGIKPLIENKRWTPGAELFSCKLLFDGQTSNWRHK